MRYLLVLAAAVIVAGTATAQIRLSLNFNLDRQPAWGPTGYDHAEYYYLPDLEVYYNVPQQRFYYNERGRWISGSSLPSRYRGHDLYNSYKVVVNEPTPYRNHETYKTKYFSFKGRRDQQPIRDSRDSKYFVNRNHPEHNNWVKQQKGDNGRGKEKGNNIHDRHRNAEEKTEDEISELSKEYATLAGQMNVVEEGKQSKPIPQY
jgi:hypothetical protein